MSIKQQMTSYKLATKLIDELVTYPLYVKIKRLREGVQAILDKQMNIYKCKIKCNCDINNIQVNLSCINEELGYKPYNDEMMLELHAIFTFVETDDLGDVWDTITEIVVKNIQYVMLSLIIDECNKILEKFLLKDINYIILQYV